MIEPLHSDLPLSEASSQLLLLLERHCNAFPPLREELASHRALTHTLAKQQLRSAQALRAWRAAIARRWVCEIAAQRLYDQAQHQFHHHYRDDPAYAQLIAPGHSGAASTAVDLLHELRRIAAALELLTPRPPFAAELLADLHASATDLEAAIDHTRRCEAERRSLLSEERVAAKLFAQACERSRRLLSQYLGDQASDLLPA